MHAAPDGAVVIARAHLSGQSVRRHDIAGRDGRLAAVVEIPADQQIVGFGAAPVHVVTTGAYDLQTLTRHRWPAAGGTGIRSMGLARGAAKRVFSKDEIDFS